MHSVQIGRLGSGLLHHSRHLSVLIQDCSHHCFLLFCPGVALQYSLWQFFHRPTVVLLQKAFPASHSIFSIKKKKFFFPFTPPSVSISDRQCLPFSAVQIPPLDICKLLPHFLFAPLCNFSAVQIYLSVFTQKSVLQVFVF